jgi:hypothetical protein
MDNLGRLLGSNALLDDSDDAFASGANPRRSNAPPGNITRYLFGFEPFGTHRHRSPRCHLKYWRHFDTLTFKHLAKEKAIGI